MKKLESEVIIMPQYQITSGIDIHKDIIVTHIASKDGTINETKEWLTFTNDLNQLAKYLRAHGVEAVLMESTGVYWISLYHILLEAGLQIVVSNPQHIKQIPKRKTDRKDARWLCTLMMNGLVRKSFIPDAIQHQLREYCRNRHKYKRLITQSNNRVVRILERANIKIRSVASSIRTKSCQRIIESLIAGEKDPDKLAELCMGRMNVKKDQMRQAVQGKLTQADIIQLQMLREDICHYEKQLTRIQVQIVAIEEAHFKPYTTLLENVSGIGNQSAQQIVAEIGTDMDKFENADHLTSWAGLAPGNHESAGKRKISSTKKGNKHLRTTMVSIAWAAVRTKDSYWGYRFDYYKYKMPSKKAIVVIARKMLKLIYAVLKEKREYVEGGRELFQRMEQQKLLARKSKFALQAI